MTDTKDTTTDDDSKKTGDKPDLQAEVEKWKALAQKHEKRARDNAAAAKQLDDLENASRSDAERIAKLEEAVKAGSAEALRLRIAAKHQISDEDADLFLTGTDAEKLEAQAKRLAAHRADQKKSGTVVAGEGKTNDTPVADNEAREFARQIFSRD